MPGLRRAISLLSELRARSGKDDGRPADALGRYAHADKVEGGSLPAMYRHGAIDRSLVCERVAEHRQQKRRFLTGALVEERFRPLRLRDGLHVQRHAPMLRIAIPYGLFGGAAIAHARAACAPL
jgi:hypothetical protein